MRIDGKDGWYAIWNCAKQHYQIFKNEKLIRIAYRFSDVKPYLI